MLRLVSSLLPVLLALQICGAVTPVHDDFPAPGSDIQSSVTYDLLKTGPRGSKLYNVVGTSVYDDAIQLIDLTAPSSFDQGYDMAFLLGAASIENYDAVVAYLLGDEWWVPPVAKAMNKFLDWQWDNYLSKAVPLEYLDEIKGLTAGGKAALLLMFVGIYATLLYVAPKYVDFELIHARSMK